MAIKLVSMKCPECRALLDVEENRKQIFCSYCGTKIMIQNDNEHIVRHIDEAGIKRSELNAMVRLKELELEEKENERRRKGRYTAYIIACILLVVGIVSEIIVHENPLGLFMILGAVYIAMFAFFSSDDDKKKKH
ncbi:MAG: hypothetical protein Q4B73_08370 [Lachnospiraceae bacterium]|nr:hypothetical protein [Lachnospiraceae bacterium]